MFNKKYPKYKLVNNELIATDLGEYFEVIPEINFRILYSPRGLSCNYPQFTETQMKNSNCFEEVIEQDYSIFKEGNIVYCEKYGKLKIETKPHYSNMTFVGMKIGYTGLCSRFIYNIEDNKPWILIKEVEDIQPKAPAYVWSGENKKNFMISTDIYSSQEDAENNLNKAYYDMIQWPALIDKETGMYPGPK